MARAKKRADGRYCAQIYLGRDENGKRQYKSVYGKSPAELKEKETAVRLQLGRGLDAGALPEHQNPVQPLLCTSKLL